MRVEILRPPRWLRWLYIGWGMLLFFWLSLEDNQTWPVAVLGTGSALLLIYQRIVMLWHGRSVQMRVLYGLAPLIGGISGIAAAFFAALLMFLKTALHAHVFPDYPLPHILAMLQRAPVWGVVGLLIGIGLVCGWAAFAERPTQNNANEPSQRVL